MCLLWLGKVELSEQLGQALQYRPFMPGDLRPLRRLCKLAVERTTRRGAMELLPASSEALVQTPIEPKLFFANERTYLHCARAHLPFREACLDVR